MSNMSLDRIRSQKHPFAVIAANSGFTIAEVLVALAIMLVVMGGIISLFASLGRSYTTQNVAAGVQQVARAGIDIMAREIRMAGFNPLNINSIGIVDALPNRIRFQYDTNLSGMIETGAKEDVAYLLNASNQLIRQRDNNPGTNISLVDNVDDLQFRYLDADDADTTVLSAIRSVEISLTVEEPAGRDKTLSRTYSTRVICRNLSLQ